MECSHQIKFCKLNCRPCEFTGCEDKCPHHSVNCGGDNIPSFKQWMAIYEEKSELRHKKTGMLDKSATRHILSSLREFRIVMGYTENDKVSVITRKKLSEYCDKISGMGVTKKSKCQKIGQSFARWIRHETEDCWVLPRFDIPEIVDDSERFHELPTELMLRVAKWYRSLYNRGHGMYKNRDRIYSMLMYRYAMRNSDVDLIKWSNIENVNGRYRINYTPHKTRLSSKRKVSIWMNPLDASDLLEFRETQQSKGDSDFIFGGGKNIELKNRLNSEIKSLGITGHKGMYVLRKICIQLTFKTKGKEAASAISGDDFDTLKTHYCDPDSIEVTAPNDDY